MALRKVEIFIAASQKAELALFLQNNDMADVWWSGAKGEPAVASFLTQADTSDELFDRLEKKFSDDAVFRIIISPVEAMIPRPQNEAEAEKNGTSNAQGRRKVFLLRISRAELYDDVSDFSMMSRYFILMLILSAVVAGIGILTDNIPVLVGAMVIAPLLGPNLALAFGTVLGDMGLVRRSTVTALAATVISLLIAFAWGLFYGEGLGDIPDPGIKLSDIILAFVSGAAGAITILRGGSSALVGVMVAVALLPPLMRAGLFAGGGLWMYSFHAFLVFLANTICVNLAGILTFLLAGITPKYWWEEKKARKYSMRAVMIWAVMLLVLLGVVLLLKLYRQ